jgi:predicted O-linked N-acetylglucosamine transferase (SPINDLY family)
VSAPGASSDALAWLEEADRLHQQKRFGPAAEHYRRALARDGALFEAWYGLGCAEASDGEFGAAIPALRRALTLRPDATRLRINLAEALFGLGYVSESVREYLRATAEGDPDTRALALRNIACIAPGDLAMDNAAIMRVRRLWAETEFAGARPARLNRAPGGKLRVGYYGAFFNARNWMKMYIGVINAHDRDRFEITMIADGELPSVEAGYRDHPDDRVWEVTGVPNHELAGHIAEYGLDVLVDMNGYSHQTRMGLLAFRSAPVQIAWSGMYATTGFSAVDCVIGDAWSVPPDEEKFCVERVRRVPGTYLAFDTFYPAPDLVPPPRALSGHVTFGSLISGYKITAEVIACWSRILHGVPGSRLLLRNRMLDRESNRADVTARFAANGIEAVRLILEGGGAHDAFLRTYDRIDIALDAFPYSGATTTAEALWQGVPVLTFNGDRWAARTSRSILMEAGLGEWVAPDQPGFEAMSIGLGLAPEGLATIRSGLRAKVAASPACDTEGLCRALEVIYLEELAAKQ